MSRRVSAMAHDGGEALASEDYEGLRVENKRKFDETVNRNWNKAKAGVPAAPVPSCNNVRPPSTEFDLANQSIVDIVAKSLAKMKRQRAEDPSDPVRANVVGLGAAFADDNFKCVHNPPAEETLPMHHRQFHQGAQCYNRGGSNQAEKMDEPDLKIVAEEAGVVGAHDLGVKMTIGTVTVVMDSAYLRILNQVPTRTFAIKVNSTSSSQNLELRWGQGAV